MSRQAAYELILRRAEEYRKASRHERTQILDGLERDTGYNRKTLIRLMKKARIDPGSFRDVVQAKAKTLIKHDSRGRPKEYSPRIGDILWEIREKHSPRSSPLLLYSFIKENIEQLAQARVIPPDPEIKEQLLHLSPSTTYRLLLHKERTGYPWPVFLKGRKRRRMKQIPYAVNTLLQPGPGNVQADTAEHCGGNHSGSFCRTLTMVDLGTGWIMLSAALGISAHEFRDMMSKCFQRYPVKIRSLQIDGGPEFMNKTLEAYAKQRGITLVASRPYCKNDQANVEERQLHVVRSFVRRHRIDTQAELQVLIELYKDLELLLNLFTPQMRTRALVETSTGRKRRVYDEPKTPFQRLLPHLPEEEASKLLELRDSLNPVFLMQKIKRARMTLYHLLQQKRGFTTDPASVMDMETDLRNTRNISARKETQTENPSGDLNYETSNPEEA